MPKSLTSKPKPSKGKTSAKNQARAKSPSSRKSLGRGLSALIPDADMEFLSRIARGDSSAPTAPVASPETQAAASDSDASRLNSSEPPNVESTRTNAGIMSQSTSAEDVATNQPASASISWLALDAIEANPFQPRRQFAPQEMEDLVQSIQEHGILQPIIVRPLAEPRSGKQFQLIAGERRWRAAQQAQLSAVPAIVQQVNDQQALELALIENIQRHDISSLDAAHAYRRLAADFQLSQEEIARRVGKSRSSVANTMRLLELPDEMQKSIEDGNLTEGHGRALLAVASEGARRALFRSILRDGLSVREAERRARESGENGARSKNPVTEDGDASSTMLTLPELRDIEQRLQRTIGTRLHIKPQKQGGQIVLSYFSLEEFDRLVELLSQSVKGER